MEYDRALQRVDNYFLTVKAFAGGGVDIDEKNEYGRTALDLAIGNDAKKIAAFLSGTLDNDGGAAAGGMTLHQAAEKDDADAVKAIAGAGADLNALKDAEKHKFGGCTPLAIAVSNLGINAVDALLSCGADPSFKDGDDRVALLFLLYPYSKAGLNKNTADRIPKIIGSVFSAGFKADQTADGEENTLLTAACKSQGGARGNVINEMIKRGCDINKANSSGETALMHVCARDFKITENIQIDLLERGADVSAADKNGDTALHYAARNDDKTGAKALCDMLLEFGADANAVNNSKKTALDIAAERENEPLVKLLLGKM
jgi:ankyrin repeat protein